MTTNTNKPVYERNVTLLFWLSISSAFYFLLMNFLGGYRVHFQLIQVIIELFTIPMLLTAIGCFVFAFLSWINAKFSIRSRPFYSLVILSALFVSFIFMS